MSHDPAPDATTGDRGVIPAGAEPSLAARIARSDVANEDRPAVEPNPVVDDQERGLSEELREGDQRATRMDRVDAESATLGEDAHREQMAEAAVGRARGSVGAAMTDDTHDAATGATDADR